MGLRVRFPSASQNVSKLWCPEMDVWVRIPLKPLIIKGRRIYERTIKTAKRTVCRK